MTFRFLSSIGSVLARNCLDNDEADEELLAVACDALVSNVAIVKLYFPQKMESYMIELDTKAILALTWQTRTGKPPKTKN